MTNDDQPTAQQKYNLDISSEDINGIIYHVDKFNNVYNTEDILKNVENPRVVGTYKSGVIAYLNL